MQKKIFLATWLLISCNAAAHARNVGPDVIVGDIHQTLSFGQKDGVFAFAIGTTSCNVGDRELNWIDNTPAHPVIAQNLYRLEDGRFQQIGLSWLKHGFFALQRSVCSTEDNPCRPSATPDHLGVGCSDPYDATLNGSQPRLGPRSEVNAFTGEFPFPPRLNAPIDDLTSRRLRVAGEDIDPGKHQSTRYFVEAEYIAADDAASHNGLNNASYREVEFVRSGSQIEMRFLADSGTVREKPAIYAWKDSDPSVRIFTVDFPGDGRCIVAVKSEPSSAGHHTELAVFNLNCDRSVGGVTLNFFPGANPSHEGFSSAPYHSGEPYSNDPWTVESAADAITWKTESREKNENANAIRWGTLYSFWVDSRTLPTSVTLAPFGQGPTPPAVDLNGPAKRIESLTTWAASSPDLVMGEVKPGTVVRVPIRIRPDLMRSIQHFRSSTPAVTVLVEKSKKRGEWELILRAAPDAAPGPFEGVVSIETGLPQDAPLTLRVSGTIQDKGIEK